MPRLAETKRVRQLRGCWDGDGHRFSSLPATLDSREKQRGFDLPAAPSSSPFRKFRRGREYFFHFPNYSGNLGPAWVLTDDFERKPLENCPSRNSKFRYSGGRRREKKARTEIKER